MKKYLLVVVATLLLAASAFAQSNAATPNMLGPQAKIYFNTDYAKWAGQIISGNTATGSQTVLVYTSGAFPGNNSSGVNPFSTTVPVQFYGEVLTPSAVSCGVARPAGLAAPAGGFLCNVTATFSNLHGNGEGVYSGDNGIMEAVADAANNGGGLLFWTVDTGVVTLNTGSVTTTTTTKVPAPYITLGGAGIVKTTITTSTSWAVGTALGSATTDFCTAQTTLTAGTTCNVVALGNPTSHGTGAVALTAIIFTMGTGAPGAGAIKARVWGFTPVQPAN